MKFLSVAPIIAAVALAQTGQARAAEASDANWDVSVPRGETRQIQFNVSEGTWMSADISPDGRWILFDLLGNIYRVAADGGTATLLTRASGISVNYHPRYSPDGRTIVFVSDRGAQDNLWLMDADGSNPRPLHPDPDSRFAEPVWTPDGKSIVATRRFQRPGMGFIVTTDTVWRMPLDGGAPEQLVGISGRPDVTEDRNEIWRGTNLWNGADRHQWPSVSPDGQFVYFQTSPYGGNPRRIQRIDLKTRQVQDVTETKDRYFGDWASERPFPLYLTELAPEVSPDGRWLAFARRIPEGRVEQAGHEMTGRTALWLRDLETGEDKIVVDPITRDAGTNLPNYQDRILPGYSWAKDSKSLVLSIGGKLKRYWLDDGRTTTIVFTAEVKREISQMTRANSRIEDDSFSPRFVRWPVTAPGGKHALFEAAGRLWLTAPGKAKPRAIDAGGDDAVQLTPAWSADGKAFVFTTATEARAGHVWMVKASDGIARQLSREPALYMRPSFSADGKRIFADRWPAALTYTADKPYWELVSLPVSGGGATIVATDKGATSGNAAHPGKRFFLKPGEKGMTLTAFDPRANVDQPIVTVAGPATEMALSPNGKLLAVGQYQDAYLVRLKSVPGEVVDTTGAEAQRITRKGARYLNWRSDDVLEMASAGALTSYEISSQALRSVPSGLVLPRAIGRGAIVLRNATIVTMNKRQVVTGDVVVANGRIACVGGCEAPAGARIIDASGKYIMPGMFDVHAHSIHDDEGSDIINLRRIESSAYLAYGVTTIHDPFGSPVPQFSIADLVEAGRIVGPRTYSTGYALTCTGPFGLLRNIETFEDALDHVDRAASYGVLSLKDYLLCNRKQRQMIVEAARSRNISVTTELGPLNYMLGQAMNGLTGWEHPLQYRLYDDVVKFFGKVGSTNSAQIALSDFSNGTALEYWYSRNNLLTDEKAKRWTSWQRGVARRIFNKKPEAEYLFPVVADGLRRIKQEGGHVAIGAHGEVVGLGTHWELWTMTSGQSGLSNDEALEAATIDSARFIGLDGELGSIVPGKIADLLVLDADPRANIRNTLSLRYVMKAGRLYQADTLDELWPKAVKYGEPSGFRADILRHDLRAE
ncbi:MAG: amidohydrolase family protein [Sphingobium sp.]